jgi:hypothetical protein
LQELHEQYRCCAEETLGHLTRRRDPQDRG